MNVFLFGRPFRKVKRDRKTYLFVILQLIIAFGILNLFFSLFLDIRGQKLKLAEDGKHREYVIEVQDREFDGDGFDLMVWGKKTPVPDEHNDFPYRTSVMSQLRQDCVDCRFEVSVSVNLIYLGEQMKDGEEFSVCYSSEYSGVRVGQRFGQILADVDMENTVNPRDFPHTISGDTLTALNGKEYSVEYDESAGNTIYLPVEAYESLYHPKDLSRTELRIVPEEAGVVSAAMLGKIISVLKESAGERFGYSVSSEFAAFLARTAEAEKEAKVFMFICVIMFIIVLVGMTGIFIMLISRRRKEIAVCCVLGQTKRQICLECFMEIFILVSISYFIGIGISQTVIWLGITVATVTVSGNILSPFILLILAVCLSLLTVLPVWRMVNRMTPVKILSSL